MKLLTINNLPEILKLTQQLNPNLALSELERRQKLMFEFDTYKCFGIYDDQELIGLSSGWITVKLYSDKQLEIDNFVISESHRGKGFGKQLIQYIEIWSIENNCKTVELNAYVFNEKAHQFYTKEGYSKIGFHFQKKIVQQ